MLPPPTTTEEVGRGRSDTEGLVVVVVVVVGGRGRAASRPGGAACCCWCWEEEEAAEEEEGPGGGRLGGGIDVSMVGSARAGDGAWAATGVAGAGDRLSMGANRATEAAAVEAASLLRPCCWSLLRDGMVLVFGCV